MAVYSEEEMLMLSGIQHFMFCPRQWALIHIEQQWQENRLTMEGNILHEIVNDPTYRQKNGDTITLRSMHIASKELGLYGITDAIELHTTNDARNSIKHDCYQGLWKPYPIEYKRGKPKVDERDMVQLAAQVMCLEEMYRINIEESALFYFETRQRVPVKIEDNLRELTKKCSKQMHDFMSKGFTPPAYKTKACNNCSLRQICNPDMFDRQTANQYLKSNLYTHEAIT